MNIVEINQLPVRMTIDSAAKVSGMSRWTIKKYVQRARAALTDFIQYQEDPANFKGRSKGTSSSSKAKGRKTTKPPKTPVKEVRSQESTGTNGNRLTGNGPIRSFPLGDGREFLYQFEGSLDRQQVFKLSLHLLAMCPDFTPDDMRRFIMSSSASPA